MVTRFISKGKGRKRKAIPITPKRKGVSVRSVSLEPQAIQKINKKTIKTLNTGEPANFSSSLNKLVSSSRLKRDSNKTIWKVVVEDPSKESGTRTHIITLGRQATEEDVRNQLLRMQENGRFMYHPQDLQFPNLHSIERKKRDTNFKSELKWDMLFERATVKKYNSGVATVNGASVHPNFHKSGSITGMRNKYYGKDAKLEPAGNFIYNVSSLVYHKDNPDEMMALKLDQFKDEQARKDLASVGL